MTSPRLFIFGLGFSGQATARLALSLGWQVSGAVRSAEKAAVLAAQLPGLKVMSLERPDAAAQLRAQINEATHLLASAPTVPADLETPEGPHLDPLLALLGEHGALEHLGWTGYLSTTVVYGDWQGAWVDEDSETRSTSVRGLRRLEAEAAWSVATPTAHIFRLAGIYGPGRNALETVRRGKARIIDKPGQVFSRTHVEDIAQILVASMLSPSAPQTNQPAAIYNVCDDYPCPPGEVIEHACALLGVSAPTAVPFDQAQMTPMARSFYGDNKRVRNDRAKALLASQGWALKYPSYREALDVELQRLDSLEGR